MTPSTSAVPVRHYVLFCLLTVAGCVADLWTKHAIFRWRGLPAEQPIWWVWEDVLGIETSLNTGALFGLGQDRVLFFAVFSGIALLGIAYWLVVARAVQDLGLSLTLGCVTGGIVGNLYDRLGLWTPEGVRPGVRDWIRISYQGFVWPNFNIADSLLVCGAMLLVWHSLRAPRPVAEDGTESDRPSVRS